MSVLEIDNVVMPPVQSLTVTSEKIWSKNTTRSANGELKGDIVAIKLKAAFGFAPLTDEQTKTLDKAISKTFFNAKFKNPRTGKIETHRMYSGSGSYPVYSYVDGLPRYVGVAVDLIEK